MFTNGRSFRFVIRTHHKPKRDAGMVGGMLKAPGREGEVHKSVIGNEYTRKPLNNHPLIRAKNIPDSIAGPI